MSGSIKCHADKTFGTATYGCTACCGFNGAGMDPGSYTGDVGSGEQFAVEGENECTGLEQDLTAISQGWASSNTSVAKLSGTAKGDISCVGAGTAEISSWVKLSIQGTSSCPFQQINMGSGITARPTVSISGSTNIPMLKPGAQGTDSVALAANGNPPGGSYSWTALSGGSNIKILNATSQSSTIQSVAVGTYTVQVAYTVNNQTGTAIAVGKVQQPGSLSIVSDTGSTLDNDCSKSPPDFPAYTGAQRFITYRVLDTSSPAVAIPAAGISATESFTKVSNGCIDVPDTPTPGNGITLSNGDFSGPDHLLMCSKSCLPADPTTGDPLGSCSVQVKQTWSANGFAVQTKTLNYQCASITLQ